MMLAEIRPDEVFPFLLGAILFMIPIIAILTSHQQKMARMMREGQPQMDPQNEALRREVEALKQLVMQQTIAIDNLSAQRNTPGSPPIPLQERIGRES